ncbi:DUF6884 domain-containing protein [Gracilibacillus alcaliphilus]|uniref:DUF6884 domain-containing protein n=1 Tax=Gracilibacillus alcaliphilus TaxID=1401441 RepID=UPI00195E5035|nr:DUF6884 domain-containing protein [Gracilibacillus alcaliphilus]MBM7679356.1 hypothetical protein [Gracilibacillus alcaliphilus]
MKSLCILPCGRKKIWDKQPEQGAVDAADAYIGVLHRLCRQYADLYVKEWVIISGKHGLLQPNDTVPGNYDLTFQPNHPEVITVEQLREQVKAKQLDQFERIIALTGKKYQPVINRVFSEAQDIQYPLLGTRGIGEIQHLLKESIISGKPLHHL